ncbi:hypothetical protein DFQ27_000832 [Actinomortierella ambigua]|uniref:Uncharacterized protein n=1 Tax=Actinomortierella ambigua TaxID=1343610 RepID=A0A9P6PMM7_9FUNG|nr:hypothetical protein DFQ27_000832 [Actinomortierella ambigua]
MSSLRVGFLIYTVLSSILICVSSSSMSRKIINLQYRDYSLDVKEGKVVGWHIDYDTQDANWDILHTFNSRITIQNVASSEYLRVDGHEVVTGAAPFEWKQYPIARGAYQIQTIDRSGVLQLTGGFDGSPVVLDNFTYRGEDAQWYYDI